MPDNEDERQLVAAAQRDPAQFAALYERHVRRVYAYVVGRVRDRELAEDVTADVFHKALKNLRTFEWRGAPFGAWLIRIAANAVADRQRRSRREACEAPQSPGALEAPEARQPPEALDFETRAELFRCVDELPEPQRTVIVERFAHDRSLRDVAAQLGKTEGSVKQLQLRALRTLRDRLEGRRG